MCAGKSSSRVGKSIICFSCELVVLLFCEQKSNSLVKKSNSLPHSFVLSDLSEFLNFAFLQKKVKHGKNADFKSSVEVLIELRWLYKMN